MPDTTQPQSADGAQIIEALRAKADSLLAASLGSTPLQAFRIGSLGNFYYNWQATADVTKFNKLTYGWTDANLAAGASPLQQDGSSSFTNLVAEALQSISWSLSTDDQAMLDREAANATNPASALQNAWLAAYGSFPTGAGEPIDLIAGEIATTWASPPTDLQSIPIALNPRQLLNKMPDSGAPILPVLVNWLNALSTGLPLQNSVSVNNAFLGQALAAVRSPTARNGAMTLNDGRVVPGYQVARQVADILNDLETGPTISVTMAVTRSSEDQFTVSVEGGPSLGISVGGFLGVDVGGSASYFADDIATSDAITTVTMSFPGVTLVNLGPNRFETNGASTGWFYIDAIRHAIANTGRDVSGFKFSRDPKIDFSAAGPFGTITGVAISGYPMIEITVQTENYQRLQQTFEQNSGSSVSFLGIPLGAAGASAYLHKVSVDAFNSTATIILAPPWELVAGTADASQGWVLGVQPSYPAA